MEQMTREQYRRSKGLPTNGLGLDHSALSPSGRCSKRSRQAVEQRLHDTMNALQQADAEFDAMVRAGQAHDPALLRHDQEMKKQRIETLRGQIRFYETIGIGKRGKLRPKFQRIIAEYQSQIDQIEAI